MILLAENFYGLTTALATTKFSGFTAAGITVSGSRFPVYSSGIIMPPDTDNWTQLDPAYVIYAITGSGTVYSGIAFKMQDTSAANSFSLFQFRQAGTIQLDLTINVSELNLRNGGGAVLGTYGIPGFATSNWYYIEMGAVISNTSGSCEVRLNGSTVISASNVDTQNTAIPLVTDILVGRTRHNGLGYYSGLISASDWYICNSQGSNPRTNTFLGDIRIVSLNPSQSGDQVDFKPLSSSLNSALMLDDGNLPDGDLTYVSASASGSMDLYRMFGYTGTSTYIYGVGVNAYVRKDDAGVRDLALAVKSGSTVAYSPSQSITNNYTWNSYVFDTNPNTSAAWGSLQDAVNSQVGFKLVG